MKNIFIFFILFFLTFCSHWDGKLILVNDTPKEISYLKKVMDKNDTVLYFGDCETTHLYGVFAHNKDELLTADKWEFTLKNKPDKILRIYIINNDSLKKYGACGIMKRQSVMKRFDLKYDDLIKLNWRIIYDEK